MCSRTQDLITFATLHQRKVSYASRSKEESLSPCLDRSLLSGLPDLHLLGTKARRRFDEEARDEEVEELMRGTERAIGHEEC